MPTDLNDVTSAAPAARAAMPELVGAAATRDGLTEAVDGSARPEGATCASRRSPLLGTLPRRLRTFAGTAVALGACLPVMACGSDSGDASGQASGSAGQTAMTAQFAPLYGPLPLAVGIDRGMFQNRNLKVQTKPYSPDSSIPLVLNGQTQIGFGGVGAIIAARSKKLPMVIVAATTSEGATTNTNVTAVVASNRLGVKSLRELSGKKIALNALGNDAQANVSALIDADGGDAKSDKWQALPFPGQAAALKAGQVDAVATAAPFVTQALAAGGRNLGPYNPEGYSAGVFFTSDSYMKENPEAVRQFVAGLQEAFERQPPRGPGEAG